MKNKDYWEKRFEILEQAAVDKGEAYRKNLETEYRRAEKEIERKIAVWYGRFAKNNQISLAEARKVLTAGQLEEFKWDVAEYIKKGEENALTGQWMKELENASARVHISRLEALKLDLQQNIEVLYGKQLGGVESLAKDIYSEGYYHTAFEVQKGFNIGWNFAKISEKQLGKVLSRPWTADNQTFRDRCWKNKTDLVSTVSTELTQSIMRGEPPDAAIKTVSEKFGVAKSKAGRLVMTESAFFASAAQQDAYKELGVEKFEIVATLDSHTSNLCQSLDGKIQDMKDYQPGVTAPPFHPWCRTCTVPYFDDNYGERIARDEKTGKTYYVPSDMKYPDWKKTFVDGGDKSGFDLINADGIAHYKYALPAIAAEILKPKKEYLTKKKLQANIANADAEIESLNNELEIVDYGDNYEKIKADYGGAGKYVNDFFTGYPEKQSEIKELYSKIEKLEAQKAEWEEKLKEKLVKEQKKALAKKQIEFETQKAALQQQLDDFEIKTYSGIWKNDVTTADFGSLNIEGKKKYYEGKFLTETDPDLMKKYQDFYDQLSELETEGKNYTDIQKELKKLEQDIKKVQSDLTDLENGGIINKIDDAFTQERKDAALWAKTTKEADDALRDKCGEVWRNASDEEKDAIYGYTSSYSKFNEPLRGIEYGTNAFKGVGKIDFDKIGTNYGGHRPGAVRKEINAMTDIIEKSTYDFDVWLQRGCDFRGMDKFFEISASDLQNASQDKLEQLLLGKTVTDYGFFSCGVSKGKGFSHKPIIMNVYAPKGTKMMYAEPFSAFGNGWGRSWNGTRGQSSFGSEAEIILQQGTSFRITKVERTPDRLYVDIEAIIQNSPQR